MGRSGRQRAIYRFTHDGNRWKSQYHKKHSWQTKPINKGVKEVLITF